MQLFDEYEKFVLRCDIEHKKLILKGNIKSGYAKTCTPWCTYSNSAVHILCLSVRATKSPPEWPWIFGHYYSIFTNMVDNIATSSVIHLGISDHSLIYALRKFTVPKTRPTIKEVRNFKHFVEVDFINDLKRV